MLKPDIKSIGGRYCQQYMESLNYHDYDLIEDYITINRKFNPDFKIQTQEGYILGMTGQSVINVLRS